MTKLHISELAVGDKLFFNYWQHQHGMKRTQVFPCIVQSIKDNKVTVVAGRWRPISWTYVLTKRTFEFIASPKTGYLSHTKSMRGGTNKLTRKPQLDPLKCDRGDHYLGFDQTEFNKKAFIEKAWKIESSRKIPRFSREELDYFMAQTKLTFNGSEVTIKTPLVGVIADFYIDTQVAADNMWKWFFSEEIVRGIIDLEWEKIYQRKSNHFLSQSMGLRYSGTEQSAFLKALHSAFYKARRNGNVVAAIEVSAEELELAKTELKDTYGLEKYTCWEAENGDIVIAVSFENTPYLNV